VSRENHEPTVVSLVTVRLEKSGIVMLLCHSY
jgi:hypothetical protein